MLDFLSDPLIFMVVGFGLLMYFMVIRPQSKQQKAHRELLANLNKGDEVLTASGLAGKIESLDTFFCKLEVSKGVVVTVQRHSVAKLLPKGTLS